MSRPLGSRYRVGAPIGSGGPGEVFLGEDELGEIYAIKVLRPDLARDADMVAQFAFERGRLQRLRGNHLVPVHDVVIEGDVLAVVMEMVPGGNLRAALANGALPPAEVSRIGAAMAKGLADIHAMGMAHGDLKPQNVLLDERFKPPKPRLTDALLAYPPHARPDSLPYLAPERWQGATPARAGDMYALGMVLYELACGVPAYAGDPADLAQSHLDHGPGRPVGVPDGLWALIVELTARDPMRRPFSSSLIAERLEELAASTAGMAAAPSLRTPPPPVPLIAPPAAAPPPPPAAPASASDATAALPPIVAPAPAPPPAPAPAWASDTTAAFPPVAASNPAAAPAPAKAPSWEDAVAAAATPAPVLASSSYRRSGERRRTYVAAGVLALLLGAGAVWAVMNTGGETTAVEPVTPQVILPVVTPTPSETPSFDPFATASPTPTDTAFATPTATSAPTPVCVPLQTDSNGSLLAPVRRADAEGQCRVDVRTVQRFLKVVPADGFFGDRTEAAVRRHQARFCDLRRYPNPGTIDKWTWDTAVRGKGGACPYAPTAPTPSASSSPSASPSPSASASSSPSASTSSAPTTSSAPSSAPPAPVSSAPAAAPVSAPVPTSTASASPRS